MKEKRYSISNVQQMINISPAELQKMLRRNANLLTVFKEDLGNGKPEICIDEESLQKLIFIRQLGSGSKLTGKEACEMIRVPELNSLKTCASSEKEVVARLQKILESVSAEASDLKNQLDGLLIKHEHLVKMLNVSQAKNITLEKEIGILRNRQAALMGQLRQNAENSDEDLEIRLVN